MSLEEPRDVPGAYCSKKNEEVVPASRSENPDAYKCSQEYVYPGQDGEWPDDLQKKWAFVLVNTVIMKCLTIHCDICNVQSNVEEGEVVDAEGFSLPVLTLFL